MPATVETAKGQGRAEPDGTVIRPKRGQKGLSGFKPPEGRRSAAAREGGPSDRMSLPPRGLAASSLLLPHEC
jgi:hypothetical protein